MADRKTAPGPNDDQDPPATSSSFGSFSTGSRISGSGDGDGVSNADILNAVNSLGGSVESLGGSVESLGGSVESLGRAVKSLRADFENFRTREFDYFRDKEFAGFRTDVRLLFCVVIAVVVTAAGFIKFAG
ncbi:MAG: hypothetical protein OXF24_06190 [Hyphomicrobiales bacterium]|nr:hypothetical protein [Hyphomicrobiales bacterium]